MSQDPYKLPPKTAEEMLGNLKLKPEASPRTHELVKEISGTLASASSLGEQREIVREAQRKLGLQVAEDEREIRGLRQQRDALKARQRLLANIKFRDHDGRPRRICDILSSTPWAVQSHSSPGFHRYPTQVLTDTNTDVAAKILKDRLTVVFADEVADELRWAPETAHDAWVNTPGAMPPFQQLWVEARTGAERDGHDFIGLAAMGTVLDLENPKAEPTTIASAYGTIAAIMKHLADHRAEQVRAIVCCTIWAQRHDGSVWGPVADATYFLDKGFRVMAWEHRDDWKHPKLAEANIPVGIDEADIKPRTVPLSALVPLSHIPGYDDQQNARFVADFITLAAGTFARTCGLMNASNVKYIEGGRTNDHISEKKRAHERLSWVRYHVLRLKVGTELRTLDARRGPGHDRPCPLTMVRGHFRDYSARGLFGKHKGEKYQHIWVPSFVRGTSDDGIVMKDYEQENPNKPEGAHT